jgi:quinol monooxygenase YgiN
VYGTCAHTKVKPENRQALKEVFEKRSAERSIEGMIASYTLMENDSDDVWMFAVFSDRETYDKNANDPAMHETYLQYRPLMEIEPEWHDGEIEGM